jgi:hypothetical protein
MNTSICVIAGPYWSNQASNNINLTMPTPTASNDYLNIQFLVSYNASNGGYYGNLLVTLPVSSNTNTQSSGSYVTYTWDSNSTSSYWTISSYFGSVTYLT